MRYIFFPISLKKKCGRKRMLVRDRRQQRESTCQKKKIRKVGSVLTNITPEYCLEDDIVCHSKANHRFCSKKRAQKADSKRVQKVCKSRYALNIRQCQTCALQVEINRNEIEMKPDISVIWLDFANSIVQYHMSWSSKQWNSFGFQNN